MFIVDTINANTKPGQEQFHLSTSLRYSGDFISFVEMLFLHVFFLLKYDIVLIPHLTVLAADNQENILKGYSVKIIPFLLLFLCL